MKKNSIREQKVVVRIMNRGVEKVITSGVSVLICWCMNVDGSLAIKKMDVHGFACQLCMGRFHFSTILISVQTITLRGFSSFLYSCVRMCIVYSISCLAACYVMINYMTTICIQIHMHASDIELLIRYVSYTL